MVLLYDRLARKSRYFLDRNKSTHSDTEKFMPREKRKWQKFFLDKLVEIGYNEPIKNEVGNYPNPFTLKKKKK